MIEDIKKENVCPDCGTKPQTHVHTYYTCENTNCSNFQMEIEPERKDIYISRNIVEIFLGLIWFCLDFHCPKCDGFVRFSFLDSFSGYKTFYCPKCDSFFTPFYLRDSIKKKIKLGDDQV